MAKKQGYDNDGSGPLPNGRRQAQEQGAFERAQFVQYSLDTETKEELKARGLSAEHFDEILVAALAEGYKCTVRFDAYSRSYAAWLIAPADHALNKGLILSGRGSTPMKALRQVLFLHAEFSSGDWRPLLGASGVIDDD